MTQRGAGLLLLIAFVVIGVVFVSLLSWQTKPNPYDRMLRECMADGLKEYQCHSLLNGSR